MNRTERRLVSWWAVLALATLLSWETGRAAGALVTFAVLLLGFAKVLAIMLQFMDARSAPWPLKAALGGWVIMVGSAVAALWLVR